jgi:hypothetical protein
MPKLLANNGDASTNSVQAGGCNQQKSPYSQPQLLIYGDLRILTMGGGGTKPDMMMRMTKA